MSEMMTDTAEAVAPTAAPMPEATPAPETAVQEAPEPDIDDSSELEAIWHKNNPLRGADGKFQSANPAAPEEAAAEPAQDAVQPEEAAVEPVKPAIDPPVSWTAEMKAKWSSLPPEAQTYVAQREKEAAQALSRLGQQAKQYEPIASVIEQNRVIFERNGVAPEQGISMLLQAQAMLDQDPASGIVAIARQYGIDLGSLQGATTTAPELLSLKAEIASLKQQLTETSSQVRSREEIESTKKLSALEAQVSDFRTANPDFDLVETEVISLIPLIRSKDAGLSEKEILAKAYEQAVWLNPELRAKRLAADQAKAAEAARKKAEEAKKVSSLNVRSAAQAKPAAQTWDDDLQAIAARVYGSS
jgi:hypothetical protein